MRQPAIPLRSPQPTCAPADVRAIVTMAAVLAWLLTSALYASIRHVLPAFETLEHEMRSFLSDAIRVPGIAPKAIVIAVFMAAARACVARLPGGSKEARVGLCAWIGAAALHSLLLSVEAYMEFEDNMARYLYKEVGIPIHAAIGLMHAAACVAMLSVACHAPRRVLVFLRRTLSMRAATAATAAATPSPTPPITPTLAPEAKAVSPSEIKNEPASPEASASPMLASRALALPPQHAYPAAAPADVRNIHNIHNYHASSTNYHAPVVNHHSGWPPAMRGSRHVAAMCDDMDAHAAHVTFASGLPAAGR